MGIMHIIEVNGIEVYAHHGCLDEEGIIGQRYTVDVKIETDFSDASKSDKLTDTIDYVVINKMVENQMKIRHHLIETAGQLIVNEIKNNYNNIKMIYVKVIKHCPPISGNVDNVAIIVQETF